MSADPIIPPSDAKAPGKSDQESARVDLTVPVATGASLDDKIRFEADLLTFRALSDVCAKLRMRVDRHIAPEQQQVQQQQQTETQSVSQKPVQLILLDTVSSTAFETETAFQDQTTNLKQSFESAATEAQAGMDELQTAAPKRLAEGEPTGMTSAAPLVSGATTALTAALGLLKVVQTETSYFGRSFTVAPRALQLELASQWQSQKNVAVFLPDLGAWSSACSVRNDVQQRLDAVIVARASAFKMIHNLSIAMRGIDSKNRSYPSALFALNSAKEQFEAADSLLRELSVRLGTPDETTKLSLLQLLERAARFRSLAEQEDKSTFLLFIEALTAGGSYRVVKNLARSIFWADGVEVAGGVVVMYGLFDPQGKLISSGLISSGKGFLTMKELWAEIAG